MSEDNYQFTCPKCGERIVTHWETAGCDMNDVFTLDCKGQPKSCGEAVMLLARDGRVFP